MTRPRYDCGDPWCGGQTAPGGCKGHRVTRDIGMAADVLAWADGWDGAAAADRPVNYYRAAGHALLDIATAKAAGGVPS